ncbi:hypothetical protein E4U21_002676 [Claviceps maximensis]|nr:hypothetical protein E4U21_002676 [Claviceps maximensis]
MDRNYDCVNEPAHWTLDYTTLLAPEPGQLPEYEPMDALLSPESIGFWPHGELPLINTDPFGMGCMAGIVSGSKTPASALPPTTASASQIAHRTLQYPPHVSAWPSHMTLDHAAAIAAAAASEYSCSQDLMQSPASQLSLCAGSPDETPVASPLTPSSEDAASSALDQSGRETAWPKADLHFQSFDAFRDDILRYSSAVADNEVMPAEWCWGIDTTAAAPLMNFNATSTIGIAGPMPLYGDLSPARPLSRRLSHHRHHPSPPSPSFLSSFHRPYPVPQTLFHFNTAAGPSPNANANANPNINRNAPCSGSASAPRTDTDVTSRSSNTDVAFVRPRRGKQSVEQRRRNHIQQEQRRRAMLKNGFSDLTDLVPGLGTRDMSKSAILEKTAEWLERLVSGNKFLRDRLALMTAADQQTQQMWTRAEGDLRIL